MTAISVASATESHETANPFPDLPAIHGPDASPQPARPHGPTARSYPRPRFGDYSRTRFESRVAFGGPDEDEDTEEVATPTDGSASSRSRADSRTTLGRPTRDRRSASFATFGVG